MLVLIIFENSCTGLREFMHQARRHCKMVVLGNISCLNYNQSSKLRRTNIHMQKTESFVIAHRLRLAQNTQLWNVHFHLKTVHIAVHMNQNASALVILYRKLKRETALSQCPQAWFKDVQKTKHSKPLVCWGTSEGFHPKTNFITLEIYLTALPFNAGLSFQIRDNYLFIIHWFQNN